jgi:PIN domain nuclease of toxin-antitoxin system
VVLILDTCGFLSLIGLVSRPLSPYCREKIARCDALHISACSLFEIALKRKRKKLDLARFKDAAELWTEALPHYRIKELPVCGEAFLRAVQLPDHHADPFDRIIIAESIRLQCPVVTYDDNFPAYGVATLA